MKLEIEVDQSRWQEVEDVTFVHDEYIYTIKYDWDNGIYTVLRPCGRIVCCVQDLMIALHRLTRLLYPDAIKN